MMLKSLPMSKFKHYLNLVGYLLIIALWAFAEEVEIFFTEYWSWFIPYIGIHVKVEFVRVW